MQMDCSPRRGESSNSSGHYESARDEELSSSSQEEAYGNDPSPSLPARILSLTDKAGLFRACSPRLSPDRTSHDGVEIQQPSSTPTSRCCLFMNSANPDNAVDQTGTHK